MTQPIRLSVRQMCDLEMLLNGGFAPLEGYLTQKDYNSVLDHCRLSNGKVWPMPIQMWTEDKTITAGTVVELRDREGVIVAHLQVEDVYAVEAERECKAVAGTTDTNHPYVQEVNARSHCVYVGGKVEAVNPIVHYDFTDLRLTPTQVKDVHGDKPFLVGFQTRNPLHRCHVELIFRALDQLGPNAHCLIHPVVGDTQVGDVNPHTRVRCYRKALPYFNQRCSLAVLPLAMRMLGPREALWHALIRRNYGCTHFIVGRDHAGPSFKKQDGSSFYGPMEAQDLVLKYQDEIGIKLLTFPEIAYSASKQAYVSPDEITDRKDVLTLSGSEFRRLLGTQEPVPEWFSFPEVIEELRQSYQKKQGLCIYLFGLVASGKSTIGKAVAQKLREQGRTVTILDGDIVRLELSKGLGFSKEDRQTNVRRIGYVASEIVRHGGTVVCANIAPYVQDRVFNANRIRKYGRCVFVWVNPPLKACEERDRKGLYAKARTGEIPKFTGISDHFDGLQPEETDHIELDTDALDIETCAQLVMKHIA